MVGSAPSAVLIKRYVSIVVGDAPTFLSESTSYNSKTIKNIYAKDYIIQPWVRWIRLYS